MGTHDSSNGEVRTLLLREGYGWHVDENGADHLAPDAALADLIPVYQRAFAESPWDERSRCPDGCAVDREFCDVAPGALCERSGVRPIEEAYPASKLRDLFETQYRDGALFAVEYVKDPETGEEHAVVGAILWETDAAGLGAAKYPDRPEMQEWLVDRFGEQRFIYRDEVFADRQRRATGNLRSYSGIVQEAVAAFGCNVLVGRTVNVRLLGKLHGEYGDRLTIFGPAMPIRGTVTALHEEVAASIAETVPDDRYLAVIELN